MAAAWFPWLVSATVLVSMVTVGAVCLCCRRKRPQAYIRQANLSQESTSEFRVFRQITAQSTIIQTAPQPPAHLLSLSFPFPEVRAQDRGHSSITADTESNPEYVNPPKGASSRASDSDVDPGYIVVLPEEEAPRTSLSGASSSSETNNYVNIEENAKHTHTDAARFSSAFSVDTEDTEGPEDTDYLNVELSPPVSPDLVAHSDSNDADDDDDDDDDDEGNYVNVPSTSS